MGIRRALSIVILAAGQGKRMVRSLPKVLHPVGGKPILAHLIDKAFLLSPTAVYVVVGHEAAQIKSTVTAPVVWVEQTKQLGTGHALQQALKHIDDEHDVLVLVGDIPLIEIQSLHQLCDALNTVKLALLSAMFPDPTGYGRIVRDDVHRVQAIIEERDCTQLQAEIKEINTGVMAASAQFFKDYLSRIQNHNAQHEYYLTDVIGLASKDQQAIGAIVSSLPGSVQGINNLMQLATVERLYQMEQANHLMQQGVYLHDPARIDVRGTISVGTDIEIDVNVIFEGEVRLGSRVKIGANCVLKDVTIEDDAEIKSHCVIEQAHIGKHCSVGPFARLRPDTLLEAGSHVGNFVEMKKTVLGKQSKANHLTYLGDTMIGERVNIGAGTITCNYDGAYKHKTIIQDDAFIGSNTALVAPVVIESGATIGAGSVVTRDAPAQALTLSRSPQKTVADWRRPVSEK